MIDIAEQLRARQIDIVEVPGWQTHARPYKFKPVGVMLHDTGSNRSIERLHHGTKWNPGPLANFLVSNSGKVYLLSKGYTNHAGKGIERTLNRTRKDESPDGDAEHRGRLQGNMFYYGVHVEHRDGGYPRVQIHSTASLCAALCEINDWTANRVIHHREWTSKATDMEYRGNIRMTIKRIMEGQTPRNYSIDCSNGVFQYRDEGECVRTLQSHLMRHGANVTPTGLYDESTKDAVEKFQIDNHITVDGIVGRQTWRYLEDSVQQDQIDTAGQYPVLQEGSINEFVNTVRVLLDRVGYDIEQGNRTFGPAMDYTVKQFQRDNGIKADGVVGTDTWGALSSMVENYASPMVCEQRTFRNGDKDPCIEHLKEELVGKGFDLPINDSFDSLTESLVRRFQKVFGISADGVVGPETWKTFERDYDLNKALVYKDNFGKALAELLSRHTGVPAVSYLDKRAVRKGILIHDAAQYSNRYLKSERIRGVDHESTARLVYNEIARGDKAGV